MHDEPISCLLINLAVPFAIEMQNLSLAFLRGSVPL